MKITIIKEPRKPGDRGGQTICCPAFVDIPPPAYVDPSPKANTDRKEGEG